MLPIWITSLKNLFLTLCCKYVASVLQVSTILHRASNSQKFENPVIPRFPAFWKAVLPISLVV